jgi:hypothetical protein
VFNYKLECIRTMLDHVDFDPDHNNRNKQYGEKRCDAYLTEWYFENHILPRIAKGIISTDWCYTEVKWVRQWFKVTDNSEPNNSDREIDKQIISQLKQLDSKINRVRVFDISNNIAVVYNQICQLWQSIIINSFHKDSDPIDSQVVIQPSQHNAGSPYGLNWQHIPAVTNNFIFHTVLTKFTV